VTLTAGEVEIRSEAPVFCRPWPHTTVSLALAIVLLAACSPLGVPGGPTAPVADGALFSDGDVDRALLAVADVREGWSGESSGEVPAGGEIDASGGDPGSSLQAVLAGAKGRLASVTHVPGAAQPWQVFLHDQSTDAKTLVYAGTREVSSVAVTGDGATLLATMRQSASDPASHFDVYRLTIGATLPENLTNTTSSSESDVSVSRDGAVIVWEGSDGGRRAVVVRSATGGAPVQGVLTNAAPQMQPSVTGDGAHVALVRLLSDGRHRVLLYDLAKRTYLTIVTSSDLIEHPSANDGGTLVAYQAVAATRDRLRIRDTTTGTITLLVNLTKTDASVRLLDHAHLTSDGAFVTYGRRTATGPWQVYTRNVATGSVALAAGATGTTAHRAAFWQLDGPPAPVDPVAPTPTRFDLVASAPIAAGQVTISHAAGATLDAVVARQSGLVVRTATVGTSTRVAWVRTSGAVSGAHVQISFALPSGAPSPALIAVRAHATATGGDIGASTLTMPAATGIASASPAAAPIARTHPADLSLAESFGAFALGDADASGGIDVRDALAFIDTIAAAGPSAFALYHSDVTGDDVTNLDDVRAVLDKIVDPNLPSALHVKPRHLSFVRLDPDTQQRALVLVGNRGNVPLPPLTWSAPTGISTTVVRASDGASAVLELAMLRPVPKGWLPSPFVLTSAGESARIGLGNMVVLIAGQSNAVGWGSQSGTWSPVLDPTVRMFGNDYRWKVASEPLDLATGQLDTVSRDTGAKHSMGTHLGGLLRQSVGLPTYLIPTALGGSRVSLWRPAADRLDRATLFGSANYRAHVSSGSQPNPATGNVHAAEGGPINVIVWYQGESDSSSSSRRKYYVPYTNEVMDAFLAEHGAPTVYVQLASEYAELDTLQNGVIAELQRRLESGYGDLARPKFFMVVANDLPRSDRIHLSAYGQRVLAERVELAIREHVLGHAVDGTGPRLQAVQFANDVVYVRTTRVLASAALDPMRFAVFDGVPVGTVDTLDTYGTNAIPITSVARDPSDPAVVRITLARAPSAGLVPYVRYMPPALQLPVLDAANPEVWEVVATGVVRDAASGLPLPSFGPLPAVRR
jgi:Tol biopolymer transport system component